MTISSCSGYSMPRIDPRLVWSSFTLKTYSPSSGNVGWTSEAAARAERQAFDVLHLGGVPAHVKGLRARANRGAADRERADLAGRRQIAFEQRRRRAEHVGDVVEAVARIVGGQQRRRIDVQRQQIADRVRVLRPVEAMDQRSAGIRLARARRDPASSRAIRRGRRTPPAPVAAAPAGASCRSGASARPSPTRQNSARPRRRPSLRARCRQSSRARCDSSRSSDPRPDASWTHRPMARPAAAAGHPWRERPPRRTRSTHTPRGRVRRA